MLSALNVHPCIILETAHSVSEEELLPKVVHTRLSRKERGQRNVERSWLKKEFCLMERNTFIHLKFTALTVINQIEVMLKRPNFPENCDLWHQRKVNDGFYGDVYDGLVWKDYLTVNGKDFLNVPRSLAFALNVDWFQPYTRRSDVYVGVIYVVLLNLPREEHFKWENVILVGIIPDMEIMPKSINPFVKPLVDEMKVLWRGVRLYSSISTIPLLF